MLKRKNSQTQMIEMVEIAKQTNGMEKIEEEKTESDGFIEWRFNMSKLPEYNISTRLRNGVIMLRAHRQNPTDIWWTKHIPLPSNAEGTWNVTIAGDYLTVQVPTNTTSV